MQFRSLRKKVNTTLACLAILLFAIDALVSGVWKYREVKTDYKRVMTARISIARSLVTETIFHYDPYVKNVLDRIGDEPIEEVFPAFSDMLYFPDVGDASYLLDSHGTVVDIVDPFTPYKGLTFNVLTSPREKGSRSAFHHQSLLTKRSVVGIQYPLPEDMSLVVERDLENIIPVMVHFEKGKLFPGEIFFVLSSIGQVVYHPDRTLIKSRHNVGFDMKEKTTPDIDGHFSFYLQGKEYIAASEEFSVPPGWTIYYAVPHAEMVKAIRDAVINQTLLLMAIFAIIFIILQVVLARFFTVPVGRIVNGLQRSHISEGLFLTPGMAAGTLELKTIIDEIHNRDEAVAQSTERFQTLLNSLDAGVYVADMETYEILFVNSYGRERWGDVKGKICWQTIQTGQSGPCPFCTNHLLIDDTGQITGIHIWEFQNTTNGKWYECRDQAIRWTDGRLVRMEVAHDISRRKEAEEELLAEKERLAVTLHSIGDGVITTDVEGRVILANRIAEEITGWAQHEALGKPLSEVFQIIDKKTTKPCADPVTQVLETGRVIALAENTILIDREGRERVIADSGAPIRDEENRIIGVVLVFRDVTEEIQLREEALKAKKLESVGVLAGGIAHDFNNILTAILGNIDLASHMVGEDHESYRLLQIAEKASIRAKGLTQQLLTFAKGGDPVLETSFLEEIVKDSAVFVLSGSNVSCVFDFQEDLYWANIDKGQISQVIQNIIINADNAMSDGGTINVKCENVTLTEPVSLPLSAGRYVKISISDTGCGIDQENLTRIFDPYFSTKEVGQGLGLAIVRSIVQKHQGHIVADSQLGKGTTFYIYLPALEPEQKKVEDLFITAESTVQKARIVIMDDEEMVREIASGILDRFGHETLHAADGEEAIKIYQREKSQGRPIDLVIMDLTIPGAMGGKEAITQLLHIDSEARVIVSSGYANDPVMANYREYGFVAAIQKPFQLSELIWIVEQSLKE